MTASSMPKPSPSGLLAPTPNACSTEERCEYTTPRGRPVVPLAAQRLAVVRAVEALVGEACDDFAVAEELLRPAQQVRQREREVHHLAVHPAHSPTRVTGWRPRDGARPAGRRSPRARLRACRSVAAGAPT